MRAELQICNQSPLIVFVTHRLDLFPLPLPLRRERLSHCPRYRHIDDSIMSTRIARVIEKIEKKDPIPIIDFTQHVLESGEVVSTQERVVKDVRLFSRRHRRMR